MHETDAPFDKEFSAAAPSDKTAAPSDETVAALEIEEAEPVEELPERRVWTVFVVIPLSIVAVSVAGSAASVAAVFFLDPTIPESTDLFAERLLDVFQTGFGPLLLTVGSIVFLSTALLAAYLSPTPVAMRLGLLPLRTKLGRTMLLISFTPVVGWLSNILMTLVATTESENMQFLAGIIQSADSPFRAVLLVIAIGLMPGLAEELLFRGYLQRRLLEVWSAPAAIAMTTFLFAAAHIEPLHVLGVLPLGAWLGLIAWHCGSTWPAVVAHSLNNTIAVIAMLAIGDSILDDMRELPPVEIQRESSAELLTQTLRKPHDARVGIVAGQCDHLGQNFRVVQTRQRCQRPQADIGVVVSGELQQPRSGVDAWDSWQFIDQSPPRGRVAAR